MSRSHIKRAVRGAVFNASSIEELMHQTLPERSDDAGDLLRLKTVLKRAVAKTDAPAYLIDAIRREVRK